MFSMTTERRLLLLLALGDVDDDRPIPIISSLTRPGSSWRATSSLAGRSAEVPPDTSWFTTASPVSSTRR